MSFGMRIEDGQIVSMQDGHMPNDFVGLDASKPANPGVGDKYAAYDTGKEYTCFISNIWSLSNSPSYSDYSNHLGTIDAMMLNLAGGVTTGHKRTLTANAGTPTSEYRSAIEIDPSISNFEFNCIVLDISEGNGATRYFIIGLENYGYAEMIFRKVGAGSWQTYTNIDSTEIINNIPAIQNNDHLTIKNYKNAVMFYVNGVLVATHITNTTWGITAPFYAGNINNGAADQTISVDYIGWRLYT